jgi:hypothetical protein
MNTRRRRFLKAFIVANNIVSEEPNDFVKHPEYWLLQGQLKPPSGY